MRRREWLLGGVGLACLAPWAVQAAPATLEAVRRRLAVAPVLRGEFEQKKTVQGFRTPLQSQGDFLLLKERGLLWRTRKPFASSLVVTHDRLLTRQGDGSVTTEVDARKEPGVRAVNEMLFAVMSADLAVLGARFDIKASLQGTEGWQMVLTPREPAIAQWVRRIELQGDRHVRQVRLSEASGDQSDIRLSAHVQSATPSPEDGAHFD